MTKRPIDYYLLWVLLLASIGFNVYMVIATIQAQRKAAAAFHDAAQIIEQFKSATFSYTVYIDEEIPVAAEVPVKFTVQVPISHTIPINTIVSVPLRTILGTFPISVPISTKVPISLTVDVPIDQVVDFKTNVPVKFDVPINIDIAETPLGAGLDEVRDILLQLATDMGAGK